VVFDGLFYQADLWLDGAYIGDPEGYFFPHAFDVTDLARLGTEHSLAVEVSCPPQRDRTAKRAVTGVFQHWDCLDPGWNPGGIWRPVRLETTGPVRIQRLRVVCLDANDDRANLAVHARLDSDVARTVVLRTSAGDRVRRDRTQTLARGVNEVSWTFGIDRPQLWWPWSLGDQHLVDVTVEVRAGQEVSHARTVRTGLRQVALRNWILSVNGERIFVKGANLGPTRMALGEATADEIRRDVALARDAGLDLVRVHGHVARPELYEETDRLGVLVWQDMPLQWGYARSVRRQAVQQAREAVDLLGHHPSLVVWCGHNEPFTIDPAPDGALGAGLAARFMIRQQLPTWNKSILDRWVKRALETADPSRPVIAHSGVLPHLPQLDGTDSHLYFGWYHGDERELPAAAAAVPRLVRFVSEFGAQAVPTTAAFMEPHRWPDLDWQRLVHTHGLQLAIFERRLPPARFATFDAWRDATQEYQATLLRHHIETFRRLKYRPTGGFCLFSLTDAHPAVSWSVLDHERVPKRGWDAVVDACRPVVVVADRPPATVRPGDPMALDVHVVSDLREELPEAEVRAHVVWSDGEHRWRWAGAVPADSCTRVGMVRLVVPDAVGPLAIHLDLVAGDLVVSNRYDTLVV
jgi:beta-mannosidase